MSFTVYKSSAGSGKTFTLVKEYLKIVLADEQTPPVKYKKILAVTFTNKASSEMKERVIKALKEISTSNTPTLLGNILQHETGLSYSTLQKKSGKILEAILHHYSDFAIGTIDSFIHRIVKAFAFDLKLPISFEIETDEQSLLQQSVELLINKIGENEKLTQILVDFVEEKADDEKSWQIENDLVKFARNLLKDDNRTYLDKLKNLTINDFIEIKRYIDKEKKTFENKIKAIAGAAFELIQSNNIQGSDFYYGEQGGIYSYFKKAANGITDSLNPGSRVITTINENKWAGSKTHKDTIALIDRIKDKLTDYYNQLQKECEKNLAQYNLLSLIYQNIYPLAVLNEIEKNLLEYKKQNNVLHISEFNNIISKIVLSQPVPFIFEKLGEKYSHYLIDEFQDTSVLQWQNLLPLIDNSLATANFNMIVGDAKQAIYRWRGGKVEQFAKLPEVVFQADNPFVKEREAALKRNYTPKKLADNFRSKHEIVEFNNTFFKIISQKFNEEIQSIYDGLEQNSNKGNTGGYIQITGIDADNSSERVAFTHKKIIETINELCAAGYSYNDICIISRENKHCSAIASFLTDNQIPVVSSESLLLKSSVNINFIIAVLNYVINENDRVAEAAVISWLSSNKKLINTTEHYLSLLENGKTSVYKLLNNEGVNFDRNKYNRLMLYELCEEITRIFSLNNPANMDVQFFLEEVLRYVTKYNNSLRDFIDWWNRPNYQPSLIVPEQMNAVKITSIHKSKGLEYPAVILPFANWKINHKNENIWVNLPNNKVPGLNTAILPLGNKLNETVFKSIYHEEKNKMLLDNINLLYVALTRAEERIYVFTDKMKPMQKDEPSSVTNLFGIFFEAMGVDLNTTLTYIHGKTVDHQPKTKKQQTTIFDLKQIISTNWESRVSIRKSSWGEELESDNKALKRGTFYHYALSKINNETQVNSTISSLCNEGLIDINEKEEMIKKINKLLSSDEIKPFFNTTYEVKTEREIILPDGTTYRPDRVLTKDNHAIIIDFKTGKKEKSHEKQINEYEEALTKMGYGKVEKYLLYIDSEDLVIL